jgi:DNA-binding NarL/FixJ family response regulator
MAMNAKLIGSNSSDLDKRIDLLRVLVCDDHPIIREAIAGVLESSEHMQVAGVISSFDEGVQLVQAFDFDVAVLDVHLKGKSGLDLAEHIRIVQPGVKVILLTAFVSDELIFEANKVGVSTIIDKNLDTERIADRVLAASIGEICMDDIVLSGVVSRLKDDGVIGLLNLSQVDRQIVALVAKGHSDKEIGALVFLSSQTVRNRISRILTLLGRSNRTQIALLLNKLDEVVQQRFLSQI